MSRPPGRCPTTLEPVDVDALHGSHGHRTPAARHRVLSGLGVCCVASLLALTAGCADRGPATEVDDGSDSARTDVVAPVFPDEGPVPRDLLVEGLVVDLTARPVDPSYWAAPSDEAECAAEAIVDAVGEDRLSELGYRPATPGASLNDIELTVDERELVVDAVEECVDMTEAVAAMFYGDGRIRPRAASCLAEGLADRGQLRPFVVAVVFGTSVDPFADDGALATAMLEQSVVCVPDGAFNWSDLDLPDDEEILDADSPGGVSGSPFVDDQRDATAATTTTTAAP